MNMNVHAFFIYCEYEKLSAGDATNIASAFGADHDPATMLILSTGKYECLRRDSASIYARKSDLRYLGVDTDHIQP